MLCRELEAEDLLLVASPSSSREEPGASEILAYALLRSMPPQAELLRLAVDPEGRRRGAASALLSHAIRRLRAEGVVELFLEVRRDNEAALLLYDRWGFQCVGARRGYYADGADALVLRRVTALARSRDA
jgi:ribosomal-protein-alanine N-acetyltransferase